MPMFRVGVREYQTVFYDIEADDEQSAALLVDDVMENEEPIYISGPHTEDGPVSIERLEDEDDGQ